MKADGIEYDERMDLLEDVSWPKPLEELLEHTYEVYRRSHPWVAENALSPKSVVRDMFERAMTFAEYVAFYGLSRSEGMLLRYLGDAYRALRQTVPDSVRDDQLTDIIEWLGAVVRQTDSSLLDEWEKLSDPSRLQAALAAEQVAPPEPEDITANERAFTVLVRNAMFRRVELLARRRWVDLAELDADTSSTTTEQDWRAAGEAYFAEHDAVDTGPDARGPRMLLVDKEAEPGRWQVQQIVGDPDGHHDWRIVATVDLAESSRQADLVLTDTGLVRL
jgi:superfamily II RNA helicase